MQDENVSGIRVGSGEIVSPGSRVREGGRIDPLMKAARKFEAMVVEGMVREMWKTIPVSREESGSPGLSLAQQLYQKELSKDLVGAGGFGLARQIVEDTRKGEKLPERPPQEPIRPTVLSVTV